MKSATVASTPQMWHAWWKSFCSGYAIAASTMIHQPILNCKTQMISLVAAFIHTIITVTVYVQYRMPYK